MHMLQALITRLRCAAINAVKKSQSENYICPYMTLLNAGIKVCANQKEKTSLGPVISILGVSPLKKDETPSFLHMLATILKPLSGFSKFLF
jgi:hypothetical protein